MIATFPSLLVLLAELLKGPKLLCVSSCYFCQNLTPFYTLALAAISLTLQQILYPFHILK